MKKGSYLTEKNHFSQILLKWNKEKNDRKMPWKGEKDPYKIWLSEIILQQTRVEQGLAYYSKFIKTFPTVHLLANASEDKVLKLWEGLGYYSRCRNMHVSAKFISKELKGKFPDQFESIQSLKGIGPYTAAAIASFAFNLPYAVVDGNVFRVLSRVFAIHHSIDSIEGKKFFATLANKLLNKAQPGLYNQAIMDFGATVCKPANPSCNSCIFQKECLAYLTNRVNKLPRKEKKILIQQRRFYFFVLKFRNKIAIIKRIEKDIWKGLYAFPCFETTKELDVKTIIREAAKYLNLKNTSIEIIDCSAPFVQKLTHQTIKAQFALINLSSKPNVVDELVWIAPKKMVDYAYPGIINNYLKTAF